MKKLFKALFTSIIILVITTNSFAATYISSQISNIKTKTPTSFSYKDIQRLEEVATEANQKKVIVVNATKYLESNDVWVVRLKIGTGDEVEFADFLLTTLPYSKEVGSDIITSLPFKSLEDGIKLYGPKWYYFGIFDDISHDSCGFIIAQRIKRWSKWNDLNYSGKTKAGVDVIGSYNEECNEEFIKLHTEILG